jgi:hypothetical protein
MAVNPDVVKKIEDGFAKLQAAKDCHSLVKKYLTKEVVDQCKDKKTKLGSNLLDVIQSGVANLDSGVGVYAPDAEGERWQRGPPQPHPMNHAPVRSAYTTFKPLFDPIIQDYHGFGPTQKQPQTDLGEGKTHLLTDLDPEGKYINSTRVRCGRSLQGYPFNPCLTYVSFSR